MPDPRGHRRRGTWRARRSSRAPRGGADVAGAQVLVGVAHAGVDHLDPDLPVAGGSISTSSVFQGSFSPSTPLHASSLKIPPGALVDPCRAISIVPRTRQPGATGMDVPGGTVRAWPFPLRSPRWPPGSATGGAGGPTTRSAPSTSSTTRPGGGPPPRCVSGKAFALGLPLSEAEGIQAGFIEGRVNPTRTMIQVNEPLSADPDWVCFSEDVVTWPCSAPPTGTRWPTQLRRVIYNGYPASSVTRPRGRPLRHPSPAHRWSAGASCSTWPGPSGATCSSRATHHPR
jgi:hypothetical protein